MYFPGILYRSVLQFPLMFNDWFKGECESEDLCNGGRYA